MKKFTNGSEQVFNAVWAGQTVVLNPGDSITVEKAIADKYAKDLAYAILLTERRDSEQEALDKGMKIKVNAVGKKELKSKMNEFLTSVEADSNIERAADKAPEEKPKKKATRKKAVKTVKAAELRKPVEEVVETTEEKAADEDFE